MPDPIQIIVPPEAEALLKRLRDRAGLGAALARTMDKQNQLTIARIQRAYMSFPKSGPATPEGTRVQSNRLRSSARATKTVVLADRLESSLGSDVVYAMAQEFGIDETVTVPAHTRTMSRGRGKNRTNVTVAVKSYSMHMHLPARKMFQKGIADRINDYGPAMLETMLAFEKGGN